MKPGDWVVIEGDTLMCRRLVQRWRHWPDGKWRKDGMKVEPSWPLSRPYVIVTVLVTR